MGNSPLGNQFAQSLRLASLRCMSNTPHLQSEAIVQSTTANARIWVLAKNIRTSVAVAR
ncbi:hypothetical protein [Helicobacter macacae]|uniref:Uncharacterized protein n=1 Tax=Helicobacter macacae MIT 99-5501 TaxID=1357400 RepID=V8C7T6_9HELI|nr:hypothetical protein [Helicobacter macacae]ETD23453.1 hypothetical protein HMPREF2086_01258 [Helicobacter macacae MIT 99-5501]